MKCKRIVVMPLFLLLMTTLSYAQQPARALSKSLTTALERKSTLQALSSYHPVFGYMSVQCRLPFTSHSFITTSVYEADKCAARTAFSNYQEESQLKYVTTKNLPVQVTPILQLSQRFVAESEAFVPLHKLTVAQASQAAYMWMLAHPELPLSENKALFKVALQMTLPLAQSTEGLIWQTEDLPHLKFLARLMDPSFKANSYMDLAAHISAYPKHITLNADGFPVPTKEASLAEDLDLYLMLSNPHEMGMYNNSMEVEAPDYVYTGFKLTKAEQSAAKYLLALRKKIDLIPVNPTPRQLLELAYNRVASSLIQYKNGKLTVTSDTFYFAMYHPYLDQANPLRRSIKTTLARYRADKMTSNYDVEHLVVLDAALGGLGDNWQDFKAINRVLDAVLWLEDSTLSSNIQARQGIDFLKNALKRSGGFWEYSPSAKMQRRDFEQLSDQQLEALRTRIQEVLQ